MIGGFLKMLTFLLLVYLTVTAVRMAFAAWRGVRGMKRRAAAGSEQARRTTAARSRDIELDKDQYRVE